MSLIEQFDFDWRFTLGDCEPSSTPSFASSDFDDSSWRLLDLPHDWSIEGPFSREAPAGGSGAWAPTGVAWYRRRFLVPAERSGSLARLEFDGAYRRARVYVNGEFVGGHNHGFSSFAFELGDRLASGSENLVAVRVDNSDAPNCRWYSGSGIYRKVRLVYHEALMISRYGLSVATPRVSARSSLICAELRAEDGRGDRSPFEAELSLLSPEGEVLGRERRRLEADPRGDALCAFEFRVARPSLWSPDSPELYGLEARLLDAGRVVDETRERFGIRLPEFRPGRGFFLNGRETKLKGVCLHGDGGCVGAAVPEAVWRRRLAALKELGCNAIRTSHNPPDPAFLELCDKLGFIVIGEIFDKWEAAFSRPEDWWMRQADFVSVWREALESSIARDRNHPCIVLWSIGNETGQCGTDEVEPWLGTLCDASRALDPTRPVTAAFVSSNAPSPEEKAKRIMASAEKVDVLCVNYQEPLYPRYHEIDPRKVIISSESFVHWRGIEASVHAFGLRNPWYDVLDHPYVAGQFLWPGIDYLGESPRWPLRGWDVGIIDTTGRLKASGQFHRSAWSAEPMVAIAVRDHGLGKGEPALSWGGYSLSAHWNWPEFASEARWPELAGRLVEVEAQTNCETVELFLNGQSYGEKAATDFVNSAVIFVLPYQSGLLRAVGRRGGREQAFCELRTAGPAAALRLSAERSEIAADGYDVACVEIELVDARGILVPREDLPIQVKLSGPGRLLGLDNGDLCDTGGYVGGERKSSGGRCLAIVGRARLPGAIELTASATTVASAALDSGTRIEARTTIEAKPPR